MNNINRYCTFFEKLNKHTPLHDYYEIFDKSIEFKDPFHHTYDVNSLYDIFQKMYASLYYASFHLNDSCCNDNNSYIRWTFTYQLKSSSPKVSFEGMSHVVFNSSNKAVKHIDYWDASYNIYEKIPILGMVIRLIKKQFRIEDE